MSKTSTLDEPADVNADLGTTTWARGVARAIEFEAKKLNSDVQSVQEWIVIAAENEAWRILGYVSLDTFLVAEAGITQEVIDAIRNAKQGTTVKQAVEAARDRPLAKHGNEEGERNSRNRDRDSTSVADRSNNYTLRRLARDAPEFLDRIEAGELSVNQAAIATGIRKQQALIPLGDAKAAARRILKHYPLSEIEAALREASQ